MARKLGPSGDVGKACQISGYQMGWAEKSSCQIHQSSIVPGIDAKVGF